ncbi:hypothetical protein [Peptacetobacter sp.]|nr:hypothetical protein [Peptacetobacter sp.]
MRENEIFSWCMCNIQKIIIYVYKNSSNEKCRVKGEKKWMKL